MDLKRLFRRAPNYPSVESVFSANMVTVEHIRKVEARAIAEMGIYKGDTSAKIAEYLNNRGELHLFDFEDRVTQVVKSLRAKGYHNVIAHANSTKTRDSYNWPLMRVLQTGTVTFDYVFIDGAHTWNVDALAFLLVDKMLRVGGHVDFDDYSWSLASSPSLNPKRFPKTREFYTAEQIREPQIKLVVDLLVRRDPRYREVVPNKIFQKIASGKSVCIETGRG
jgi:predicted O-methyltransferase YrrM